MLKYSKHAMYTEEDLNTIYRSGIKVGAAWGIFCYTIAIFALVYLYGG